MKFGRFPIADCEGAYLAHSIMAGAQRLKKGVQLTSSELNLLRSADVSHVTAAILEEGDVHEDEAAKCIAEKIMGTSVSLGKAFTGRVNIIAEVDGLLDVDAGKINTINAIDEALTVATLNNHAMVRKGQMVATAKVIPLAASAKAMEVLGTVEVSSCVTVKPYTGKECVLVQTELPIVKSSLYDKTSDVLEQRVRDFGAKLSREIRCIHEVDSLAQRLLSLEGSTELVLIIGASAITDRRDVIPAGIVQAGGHIIHFGMPVDPGNLLLVARLGEKWVLGLPGCARSPKLNGIDQVLSRLCAGMNVRAADIMGMGVGGLLSEYVGRPQPRGGRAANHQQEPLVAIAILAAGRSSRMGAENKLLLPYKSRTVLDHVITEACAVGSTEVFVISGHDSNEVEAVAEEHGIKRYHNADYASGMASSVKAAISHVPNECDGVLMVLGDMPAITSDVIAQLIAAYNPAEGRNLIMPVHNGKWGNPVLWGKEYFSSFEALQGDTGAKALLREFQQDIIEVEVQTEAIFMDIDTAEAYRTFIEGIPE